MTKVAPILFFLPSFVICSQSHLINTKDYRINTQNNNNNGIKQTNQKNGSRIYTSTSFRKQFPYFCQRVWYYKLQSYCAVVLVESVGVLFCCPTRLEKFSHFIFSFPYWGIRPKESSSLHRSSPVQKNKYDVITKRIILFNKTQRMSVNNWFLVSVVNIFKKEEKLFSHD